MALKEMRTTLMPQDRRYVDIFLKANKLDNIVISYYTAPSTVWKNATNTYILLTYDDADAVIVGDIVAMSLRHGSLVDAMIDFIDRCRLAY